MRLTHFLIILSIIFSVGAFLNQDMYYYGMGTHFFIMQDWGKMILQFLLYSFIHGGIFHLFFNGVVLYYFGTRIEDYLGTKIYIIFFLIILLGVAGSLFFLSNGITVGISGFGMALMSFYAFSLYRLGNDEYKAGIIFIVGNVLIGFVSQISLIGHLSGAIFGILFFLCYEKFYKIYQ